MLDGVWLEQLLLYFSLLGYFLSELNKWHTLAVKQSNHQIKVENHIIYQLKFNNRQESGYLESGNLESGKSQESYPFTFDIDLSVLNFGFPLQQTNSILSSFSRIVYPTKKKNGAYADLILSSSCLQNKKYDVVTDRCL